MIYTVTFNPAIDYIMRTGPLQYGGTNRSESEEIQFGGKGVNVSAVLTALGVENTALGFIGGFTGEALAQAMARAGVQTDFVRLEKGCTRINVKLKGDTETEINAQGPEITKNDMDRLYKKLDKIQGGDTLAVAGSVPKTLPQDTYAEIFARLSGRGVRFVADAAGALLTGVLEYRPFLIKPNRDELEEIAGEPLDSDEKTAEAARALQRAGAVNVLVSLGRDGALLLDEFGTLHRKGAAAGRAVNTVGAGDSMVAGFLAGVEKGYGYALALGCAAGSATAFSPGLATREAIFSLL